MSNFTLQQAAHLARKTGFSALPSTVQLLMESGSTENAIERLFNIQGATQRLPNWHNALPFERSKDPVVRSQNKATRIQWSRELRYWWFTQMLNNPSSLQEKMTLFWANHFTSSLRKVKWPPAMLAQNQLLRRYALGNFRDMLKGVLQDPAMLIYLDNVNNHKRSPNENLARELLELFTMGEGNYLEQDIKELSRALTGASIDRSTKAYLFKKNAHDDGSKTLFGESGYFTPDDVANLILKQEPTARFIAGKIWAFLVGNTPSEEILSEIAWIFSSSDYDISLLIKNILQHDTFWQSKGLQIKSPMELLVGSTQLLEMGTIPERRFIRFSKMLGQDLFNPPNVKGWPEGLDWYNTSTLLLRERFSRMSARKARTIPDLTFALATDCVVQLPDPQHKRYLFTMLTDPAYQVI